MTEYREDRCAHRWPLMFAGLILPAVVVLAVIWGVVSHFPAAAVVYVPALILALALRGDRLILNWPTGIRVDEYGVRIGGVRRERLPKRFGRKKDPAPSFQCYQVFACDWNGIDRIDVVTDHRELRTLRRRAAQAPHGNVRARGSYVAAYYLGMMIPPYMRAALVLHVDLEKANVPTFRNVQALAVATSQAGAASNVWVAPTRRPAELARTLQEIVPSTR